MRKRVGRTTTSTSGITRIDIKEISKLLRDCRKTGVKALTIPGLAVEFKESGAVQSQALPSDVHLSQVPLSSTSTEEIKPQLGLFDNSEIQEMERAQQLMDDPYGFEQEEIRGSLEEQRLSGGDEKISA